MPKQQPAKLRLDGLHLTDNVDDNLNRGFARTFGNPEGRALLHYLRQLTTQRSLMPAQVTEALALHHAGACWLMNVIDGRITAGHGKIMEDSRGPEHTDRDTERDD